MFVNDGTWEEYFAELTTLDRLDFNDKIPYSEKIVRTVAKTGQKKEFSTYRQMLLFQKKLSSITDRHVLQFEKFLGDGAFYTTRRAIRLVYAAVEIQRFYSEMRRKGFAFDRGLRVALNYGYYRLLPLKGSPDSVEHVIEFYGPGIVERIWRAPPFTRPLSVSCIPAAGNPCGVRRRFPLI